MFTCARNQTSNVDKDTWRQPDNSCSYCGSMNPDDFMARVEAGDVILDATDKDYKVYVRNHGGADFKQTYREGPYVEGVEPTMITRDQKQTKFYFYHLSEEQMKRFVDMYNENKLKFLRIGDGGEVTVAPRGFYRLPYFMKR